MSPTFVQNIYYQRKPHALSSKQLAYAMGLTYFWVALGILTTSLTAFLAANTSWLQQLMQTSVFYFLIFTQFLAAGLVGLFYRKCHYYADILQITGNDLNDITIQIEGEKNKPATAISIPFTAFNQSSLERDKFLTMLLGKVGKIT